MCFFSACKFPHRIGTITLFSLVFGGLNGHQIVIGSSLVAAQSQF